MCHDVNAILGFYNIPLLLIDRYRGYRRKAAIFNKEYVHFTKFAQNIRDMKDGLPNKQNIK